MTKLYSFAEVADEVGCDEGTLTSAFSRGGLGCGEDSVNLLGIVRVKVIAVFLDPFVVRLRAAPLGWIDPGEEDAADVAFDLLVVGAQECSQDGHGFVGRVLPLLGSGRGDKPFPNLGVKPRPAGPGIAMAVELLPDHLPRHAGGAEFGGTFEQLLHRRGWKAHDWLRGGFVGEHRRVFAR